MLCESAEKFGSGNGGLLWFIWFGVGVPTIGDGACDGVVGDDPKKRSRESFSRKDAKSAKDLQQSQDSPVW